jgi:hypothetical protein
MSVTTGVSAAAGRIRRAHRRLNRDSEIAPLGELGQEDAGDQKTGEDEGDVEARSAHRLHGTRAEAG